MQVVEKDITAFHNLLSLVDIAPLGVPNISLHDGEGCVEKQLKPNKRHLAALIFYMAEKDHIGVSVTNTMRRQLFFPDPNSPASRAEACRAALAELEKSYDALASTNRAWYVFEGYTNPDIFIEGDTNKKVYAFYIVDKGCGYEADLSPDAFAAQLEKETIKIPSKEKEEIG